MEQFVQLRKPRQWRRAKMDEAKVPQHIDANVQTIASMANRVRRTATRGQRRIERITITIARPSVVTVILALACLWCFYNSTARAALLPVLDPPPFFWLQGVVGFYAAIVATMVLVVQRRQTIEIEQRDQVELQVNLLAEQKATKIIALLEELRRDLPLVQNREDPIASALQEQVDPNAVLTALEATIEAGVSESSLSEVHRSTDQLNNPQTSTAVTALNRKQSS